MPEPDAGREPAESGAWPRRLAFGLSAAAIALLALRGGTYDVVARQEAGILIWWVLGFGILLGVLPRSRPDRGVLLPLAALAGLGAWTAASLSWTESDERTLVEVCRVVTYLGLLLLVIAGLDRRTWGAAAAGAVAGALLVAALAAASRLLPGPFPRDPVFELSSRRLNYPFDYWNAVGAWGAMAVTGALSWSVSVAGPYTRALFLGAIPAAGLSIYLSYSRAAIAGLAVGVLCVLGLSRRRVLAAMHLAVAGAATAVVVLVTRGEPGVARGTDGSGGGTVLLVLAGCSALCAAAAALAWRVRAEELRVPPGAARVAVIAAAGCLLVAALVAAPTLGPSAWAEFRESGTQPSFSGDPAERLGSLHGSRYSVWSEALDAYRDNPTLGTGAGTFEYAWNQAGRSPEFIRDAHSIYLEPLAELGWPGAVLTLLFLVAAALLCLRAMRRTGSAAGRGAAVALIAVLAVFLVQAGVDWMWEMTAVGAFALAGAAVLWARLGGEGPPPRLPVAVRVPAAAGCLLMCLVLLPGLVSPSLVRESQRAAAAGDLRAAAAKADDAVASSPWAATPRLQRGLVAEAAGDLRSARADMLDAIAREPDDWRLPLLLARIEAERGRPAAALRQFKRARHLRPAAAVFGPRAPR